MNILNSKTLNTFRRLQRIRNKDEHKMRTWCEVTVITVHGGGGVEVSGGSGLCYFQDLFHI